MFGVVIPENRGADLVLSNGESSRPGRERLRSFLAGLAGGRGPVAVVSHGGVTVDLLRNLLGDDGLPLRLAEDHIPPCAITTFDDLHVIGIAATSHLTDRLPPATEVRCAPLGPGLWPSPSGPLGWQRSPALKGWFGPASLEAAISANCSLVYQIPVPDNRFPRTFSGAYHRYMSGSGSRYTTAPSPSLRASRHRLPASPSSGR